MYLFKFNVQCLGRTKLNILLCKQSVCFNRKHSKISVKQFKLHLKLVLYCVNIMSTQPVTNTKKSIGVAKHTFDNKKLELDAENEWIDHDGSFLNTTTGVFVVRITCLLCTKHQVKISNNRSFSDAFIKGVEGS